MRWKPGSVTMKAWARAVNEYDLIIRYLAADEREKAAAIIAAKKEVKK